MKEEDLKIQKLWTHVFNDLVKNARQLRENLKDMGQMTGKTEIVFLNITYANNWEEMKLNTPYVQKRNVEKTLWTLYRIMREHNKHWGYFVVRDEMIKKIDTERKMAELHKNYDEVEILTYWLARLNDEEPVKPVCIQL